MGVHQIEAGIPAMGGDEKEAVKGIAALDLGCSIMAWNRAVVSDVEHSLDCGVDAVAVSISASDIHIQNKLRKDRQFVLDSVKRAVDFAKDHRLYVSVNAEDASRADPEFLVEFASTAKAHGADRVRYCDTVGMMDPFRIREQVEMLVERVGLPVEMHTHNDFGMATANALAGIWAGATYVNTTVNGLGERAGNAALEEVVMALKYLDGHDTGIDTTRLRELAEYVSHASGRFLPTWKAIVGDQIFTHESGIHADGVLKDPRNYEAFPPEAVGLTRQLLIGKHSGSAAVVHKFHEFGMELDREEAGAILELARSMSVELKRPLFDKELVYIYQDYRAKAR
jgi:homocitrate synthase NifV